MENSSRKDTISSHHNAGNNDGRYTPVKSSPTARYKPMFERERERMEVEDVFVVGERY